MAFIPLDKPVTVTAIIVVFSMSLMLYAITQF